MPTYYLVVRYSGKLAIDPETESGGLVEEGSWDKLTKQTQEGILYDYMMDHTDFLYIRMNNDGSERRI